MAKYRFIQISSDYAERLNGLSDDGLDPVVVGIVGLDVLVKVLTEKPRRGAISL